MNIYDFDKTIYSKDATKRFFLFCVKKNPLLFSYIIPQMFAFFLYIIGLWNKKKFKEVFFRFLRSIKRVDIVVEEFWKIEEKRIADFFKQAVNKDDIIISASPYFLLYPVCSKYCNLIATNVDEKSGRLISENCYGEEKVRMIKEMYPNCEVINAYSDSLSDLPILRFSKNAYIVRKGKPVPLDEYKFSNLEKIKTQLFSRQFMLFFFIGIVNATNGVFFAYIFSIFLNANLSFIIGYIIALNIAYFLNAFIIFKKRPYFRSYFKFYISYIPNFILQNVVVYCFYNILEINKLIAFSCSALISLPITFLCVKFFGFKINN